MNNINAFPVILFLYFFIKKLFFTIKYDITMNFYYQRIILYTVRNFKIITKSFV